MRLASSALLTDLYQLTMLQGYFEQRMEETAVFELFVRTLPANRGFLIAAGLEQALDYLENLHITPEELEWLGKGGRFSRDFLAFLGKLRFTGDVYAMPEGTVCFPPEPLLRVVAPLPQAQLVESRLLNLVHLQTMIASKAARTVLAARGKGVVDFGFRRAHGAESGLLAARTTYLVGMAGSATVAAGLAFDIPIYGTMAHSFIEAHDDELQAFEHFARAQPDNVILLIDTYDTELAARKVVALARRLHREGIQIKGVRIDSGDLAEHARRVRRILDDGGLQQVRILASGNLDEFSIQALETDGAPIDDYAVGTRLVTSVDAPYLDCVYKLQEYAGRPRRKRSEGKATWPGRKQVYRRYDASGRMAGDWLTLDTDPPAGEALLQRYVLAGKRVFTSPSLPTIRQHVAAQLARLPEHLRQLKVAPAYSVTITATLNQLAHDVDSQLP
jgi:nicotinate phosphoribosyltransferase